MLSKQEYDNLEKMLAECNCTHEEIDLGLIRKGASSLAQSLYLRTATTKDLVLFELAALAKARPMDQFHVKFDGISGFSVMRNEEVILESNFYEVEKCYQQGPMHFRSVLQKVTEK